MTGQQLADEFYDLPYEEKAIAFKKITTIFNNAMETELQRQLKDKFDQITEEWIGYGIVKLTNVHGNVYIAAGDYEGMEKYGTEGWFFWKEDNEKLKTYLKGDLNRIKQRICNL